MPGRPLQVAQADHSQWLTAIGCVQDAACMVADLGGRAALPVALEAMQQALQRRAEAATLDTMPALSTVC